jgi:hypothetical protein
MKKARPTPALILAPLMMVLTSMQTSFSYANADNLTWLNKNVSAAKKTSSMYLHQPLESLPCRRDIA